MPRDIEKRVRKMFSDDIADKVISKFSWYFVPDWSEASDEEIDGLLHQVAGFVA
jgi:hypothetical protein